MEHELKIWPQYFQRVFDGTKTFEVRKNDRGFQSGDIVVLREWNPEINEHDVDPMGDSMNTPKGYSGRKLHFKVGYILPLLHGEVVFSLLKRNECKHQWVSSADSPKEAWCTDCTAHKFGASS